LRINRGIVARAQFRLIASEVTARLELRGVTAGSASVSSSGLRVDPLVRRTQTPERAWRDRILFHVKCLPAERNLSFPILADL